MYLQDTVIFSVIILGTPSFVANSCRVLLIRSGSRNFKEGFPYHSQWSSNFTFDGNYELLPSIDLEKFYGQLIKNFEMEGVSGNPRHPPKTAPVNGVACVNFSAMHVCNYADVYRRRMLVVPKPDTFAIIIQNVIIANKSAFHKAVADELVYHHK